jgi:hypothetical protein
MNRKNFAIRLTQDTESSLVDIPIELFSCQGGEVYNLTIHSYINSIEGASPGCTLRLDILQSPTVPGTDPIVDDDNSWVNNPVLTVPELPASTSFFPYPSFPVDSTVTGEFAIGAWKDTVSALLTVTGTLPDTYDIRISVAFESD